MAETRWQPQAGRVAATLDAITSLGPIGVYVHGSAALGGWTGASDLDVLVTSAQADAGWRAVGEQLLAAVAPEPVVELSVVSTAAAGSPGPPWPFLLHVNQADGRVVVGGGDGDPDLLMHFVVARAAGVTIKGPPATTAFGSVAPEAVLRYLLDELAWGVAGADERYAVLNACRALAYGETGSLLSKMAGGAWALQRADLSPALITAALAAQASGLDLGPCTPEARALVAHCRAALADRIGRSELPARPRPRR